jgi:hypothetical protein
VDTLLSIVLAVSSPILSVVGLTVIIKWVANGGNSAEKIARRRAADAVRRHAASRSPEVATALLEVAVQLDAAVLSRPIAAAPTSNSTGAPTVVVPQPVTPVSKKGLSHDIDLSNINLNNINVILYLGAFLIVVSAGIFVGYNLQTLTGTFKSVFIALFAGLFYICGLLLFTRSTKLRPAGVTFTGIGLVLTPLVGLAAYNFTALHDYGPMTWFVTSVLTLALYIITLTITRQTYIAYLMSFTTLSIFESSISLINLPLYWFGWAMSLSSLLLLTFSRSGLFFESSSGALMISANLFMPISLLLSLAMTGDNGLAQLGVTIAIAGVFYAGMARQYHAKPIGSIYWSLALISLPLAIGLGLWHSFPRSFIALVLLAVGAIYLIAEHLIGHVLSRRWHEILSLVTGLLPLAGLAVVYDHPGAVTGLLVVTAVINAEQAMRLKQSSLGLVAILSFLALPLVYSRVYLSPSWPYSAVAALYLVEAGILVWWSRVMHDWAEGGLQTGRAGYFSAFAFAIVTAALSSQTALLLVALAAAAAIYILSYIERLTLYVPLAVASLYLALLQPAGIFGWSAAITALLLLLGGLGVYSLGRFETDEKRSLVLRYSGLAGPYLGAAAGLSLDPPRVEPVLALAGGGGLLWLEAQRQNQPIVIEVAGAILLVSLNWLFAVLSITETQFYTVPWAAYAGYLGYRRRSHGHQAYDGFTVLALAVLTLPLAAQALSSDGQLYGLALICESLVLVVLGMAFRYKLVTLWGVATLVTEVLYQMRSIIYALPKYLISAALGLGLLATAIIMLQRRKGGE